MSEELEKPIKPSSNDRFPRIILFILVAECCERMSYSGMRVFLTLYLRNKLGYTDDEATEIYHIFNGLVYLCPIFGGIIADNYLGKYRTILYMMFVYVIGNSLVTFAAIPQLMLPGRLCTLIGLFMITLGTGGIKPCVTAFGGEQFKLPQQERLLSLYFSVLYINLCIGSLIAKTLAPIFRAEFHCFGEMDCYSLAFGAPVIVIIVSMVVFVSGRRRYVIKKPEGNIVVDFTKCIYLGLKQKISKDNRSKSSHWLDGTRHRYDRKFIDDIKKTLSVLKLFFVLPVFWALLDQMGSRWALQASRMDGRLGFYTIKPDQMLILSPVIVLSFIVLSHKYIYPFLAKWNLLTNPLHKITLGGIMAGLAFVASGSVETYLKATYPELPQPGYSQLRIFNGNTCAVSIFSATKNITYLIPPLSHFVNKRIAIKETENVNFNLDDGIDEPVLLYNTNARNVEVNISYTVFTERTEVYNSIYSLHVGEQEILNGLQLESGGVYTFVIAKVSDTRFRYYTANMIVVTEPNSVSMLLLIPQFVLVSIAEVLFAVTGNEFAFKEAPENMKAVVTAIWLLTEALGNVFIIIYTRLWINIQIETQFFLYATMMFLSMATFHYISRNYQFSKEVEVEEMIMMKEYKKEVEMRDLKLTECDLDSAYLKLSEDQSKL